MEKLTIDLSKAKKLETKIIARGEISNHAHAIVGDADLMELNGEVYIQVYSKATLKHILENEFIAGNEVWTKEHTDIDLDKGNYKFVQQVEFNPYEEITRKVKD